MSDLYFNAPGPATAGELICPGCGDREPQRIAYGYPSPDMWESVERGEIVLGGCVISGTSSDWRCRRCGRKWVDGRGPSIEGVAAIWLG